MVRTHGGIKYLREQLQVEPLQAWTKKGRVKVSKKMSEVQMKNTINATLSFLHSSISTKTGIKKVIKKSTESIRRLLSNDKIDLSYKEAEALENIFNDKEVNQITNYIPGSTLLVFVDNAKEKNINYNDFSQQLKDAVKYNKGKNIESILRKIYIKYVYNSISKNEIEILYNNIIELINNAKNINDLEEVENIINSLRNENKIDNKEFNYLINLVNEKRDSI